MELIFFLSTIKLGIKIYFIIFLFFVNMYLIITHNIENYKNGKVLHSGFGGNKNIRLALIALGTLGANLSAIITIKNEYKDQKLGTLVKQKEDILKAIENDKIEYELIKQKIELSREELQKLLMEKTKHLAQNNRLSVLDQTIKKDISIFKEKSASSETRLSELLGLSDRIKLASSKYKDEVNNIINASEASGSEIIEEKKDLGQGSSGSVDEGASDNTNNVNQITNPSIPGDIKKSMVLPFESSIEWFDSLIGIQKLAVGLILGKSVILSALISIIFIFYGNILIDKYDLVNKYPKLAKIIELRRKYQKYYFNFSCLLIFLIVINELLVGFSLLFI